MMISITVHFQRKKNENIVQSKSEGFEEYNTSMNLTGGGKPYAYLERELFSI